MSHEEKAILKKGNIVLYLDNMFTLFLQEAENTQNFNSPSKKLSMI